MDGMRALTALAGLAGAAGVALSAAAAHAGGPNLATAAQMLLVHAPAFLGLAAVASRLGRPAVAVAAGLAIAAGLLLFSGTLASTALGGPRPFPMAAPTGGTLMILGWLGVVVSALLPARR